ncbi:transglycosylase family protein [Arthrobacter sp. MSA 4-2]|uniref:resuscitation-promoting factor n=1 Tax=Arthrobacter sp. MSA 4-2 TaxID=2794349 RepID=UPI0018E75A4C|nr:resuscitation-promoting factor [Arthrobacter sp. MSA 4-2]MBJ2119673.1 transglycosylase family protein [Arthrobacter sp. MSA 4-2]
MGDPVGKRVRRHWLKRTGQTVVMMSLVSGLVAFVGNGKQVELTVEGRTSTVQTYGGTVEEILAKAGVPLGPHDDVVPARTAEILDGAAIEVRRAQEIDLILDGVRSTHPTTVKTIGDLLAELGLARTAAVSLPPATELSAVDSAITVRTQKRVALTVGGTTSVRTTSAVWLPELLAEAKITLGAEDRISVPASTAVIDGLGVKITRITSKATRTFTEPIPFESVETEDPGLPRGERKVTVAGVDGERTSVYAVRLEDGKEVSRRLLSRKVTREPVHEEIAVGTRPAAKPRPETAPAKEVGRPAGGPAPQGNVWAALAECESGGNWSINSGNGYYGGLQFSRSSWLGAGGGKYAPLPHLATPAEQIATAEVLKGNGGWGHWPSCASKLGLR